MRTVSARESGPLAEVLQIADSPAVLVDPALRVGFDGKPALDSQPGGDDHRTDEQQRHGGPGRQVRYGPHRGLDRAVRPHGPAGSAAVAQHQHSNRHGQRDGDEHGDPHGQQPAEVLDHRHLRPQQRQEADDRGHHRQAQRRGHPTHRPVGGRLDRASICALLLEAVVHLDGEVDPEPDEDRQARDRDQRERDAGQPDGPEGADGADHHDDEGQQPPPGPEHHHQQERHHAHCDRAEQCHAAAEIVVDLGEQLRRAAGEHLDAFDRVVGHDVIDQLGRPGLVVDRRVAGEADEQQRVAFVEEVVAHCGTDLAIRTEHQELGEGRVVQRLLAGSGQPAHLGRQQLLALGSHRRAGRCGGCCLFGGRPPFGGRR